MKITSKLVQAAFFAALLGLAAPAGAQGKTAKTKVSKKAKVSKKSKAKTSVKTAKTKVPKTKDYDFLADEIDGDRPLPNHDRILGLGDTDHPSLIRLRVHFMDEIIRSADML